MVRGTHLLRLGSAGGAGSGAAAEAGSLRAAEELQLPLAALLDPLRSDRAARMRVSEFAAGIASALAKRFGAGARGGETGGSAGLEEAKENAESTALGPASLSSASG